MIAFPAACDALVTAFRPVVGVDVFDGPPAQLPGTTGIAVGATREDIVSEWVAPNVDLGGGIGEDLTVTCLTWSGSGGVVFKPHRDAVRSVVETVIATLHADPTVGGAVDTAAVLGGSWTQEQTGEGALVTCEFRLYLRRF